MRLGVNPVLNYSLCKYGYLAMLLKVIMQVGPKYLMHDGRSEQTIWEIIVFWVHKKQWMIGLALGIEL